MEYKVKDRWGWNIFSERSSHVFARPKHLPAFFLLAFLILFITQCQKDTVPDPGLNTELNVKLLAHKGGGNNSYNDLHIENTLPSVQDGLKSMDGVEVDLQMSLDGTIWLFHHPDVGESCCDTSYHRAIPLLTDSEVQNIKICSGTKQARIYKLSELVDFWNADSRGFYISMHVKLDFPAITLTNPKIGGEAKYLSKMADGLAKLFAIQNHQNQLFLEVYDAAFCTKIHSTLPNIKVCLIKEVSFQQQIRDAINLGYDGISCIFSEPTLSVSEVKRAKDNGLIVLLWTPDSENELQAVYDLQPDFIQTNNLSAISLLKKYVAK
jgi:glycerophosphoryl diester phosphodiesterase